MADDSDARFSYSRCSSAGSLHTLPSSTNNSDDEDSDSTAFTIASPPSGGNNIKDKRREAHTQAEQKRRDSIKKGYDALQELVPMCSGGSGSDAGPANKLSKATVLQRSIEHIEKLQHCKEQEQKVLAQLEKDQVAYTILKLNYENIVAAHHRQRPGHVDRHVSDQIKFQVFRAFLDSLFQTFEPSVIVGNFAEMSGSVIHWLEEHCKPHILREIMLGVLQQLQEHEAGVQQQQQQQQSDVGKVERYY